MQTPNVQYIMRTDLPRISVPVQNKGVQISIMIKTNKTKAVKYYNAT